MLRGAKGLEKVAGKPLFSIMAKWAFTSDAPGPHTLLNFQMSATPSEEKERSAKV